MNPDNPEQKALSFPPRLRVRERKAFERILKEGPRVSDGRLLLRGLPNGLAYSRLGLLIRRQHGDSPRRNLLKRWIREVFRVHQYELPPGIDFLCSPIGAAHLTYAATLESLPRLAQKLARRLENRARGADAAGGAHE
jgi:ribonuclease P protein component